MKPTLEEVKAYFKNAKEVGCIVFNNSKDISVLEIKEYDTVFTAEDNLGIAHLRVYDKKTNKYAEIISYKDEPLTVSKEFILEAHNSACPTWKRKLEEQSPQLFEVKPTEMTVAEIEAKLGCKIKIVG